MKTASLIVSPIGKGEGILLSAMPAAMGWSIIAELNGEKYLVEGGLATPDERMAFWQENLPMIEAAIKRAQ